MRLTVQDASRRGLLGSIKVRLDGRNLSNCIMADEEQGMVEVLRPDWIIRNPGGSPAPYSIPVQKLQGRVQILMGDAV